MPDYTAIYAEYKNGVNINTLANKYKIDRTTLYGAFRVLGYPVRLPQSDKRRKLSIDDEAHLCDLYQQGSTMQQLAEEFGYSIQGVNKILIRNGIKKRKNGPDGMRKNTRGKLVK